MKPRWRTVSGVLLAIVALWWLALAQLSPSPKTQLDGPQSVPATTVASAERREPPAAQAPSAKPIAEPMPMPKPPAQAPAKGPAAHEVIMPPDSRGFVEVLQQRFDSDPSDREAGATESALLQLVADTHAATLVRSVVCHHTVCKLALRWHADDDRAYQRLLERLMGDNAKLFATRAEAPDDTGKALVDAYWVRR